MNLSSSETAFKIKQLASQLGFDACGIACAKPVKTEVRQALKQWLAEGKQAGMAYMNRYFEQRCDPRLLVEGAQSVLVFALNYYPAIRQPADRPQFAYYAYGADYHEVIKKKLFEVIKTIQEIDPQSQNRAFVDTAPLLERYWAQEAGIGFIGKNQQLILPTRGSYFFLGVVVSTLKLPADTPITSRCGDCERCINGCPAKALSGTALDANRCLSYQTIEHRGELSAEAVTSLGNRIYGCDACQQACPHNRMATPCSSPEFQPSSEFLSLTAPRLKQMQECEFKTLFRHSAIKRTGYDGLMRNLRACLKFTPAAKP